MVELAKYLHEDIGRRDEAPTAKELREMIKSHETGAEDRRRICPMCSRLGERDFGDGDDFSTRGPAGTRLSGITRGVSQREQHRGWS